MDYQRNNQHLSMRDPGRMQVHSVGVDNIRPLAMVYPEKQKWEEPYSMTDALCIGTVFPSLDMPFLAASGRRNYR